MKRRHLVLTVLAAVVLALAAIVAAFYKIENVRGARAWEQARRELAAQGESLDPADFIPPPVPDDANLAMIPLFVRALDYRVDPQTKVLTFGPNKPTDTLFRDMPYGRDGQKPKGVAPGGWEAGQPLSLAGAQQFYAKRNDFPHPAVPGNPSEDVLRALTKFAPAVGEIEAAIPARPQSRFPVDWLHWPPATLALPQDNLIQQATGVFRLRTSAHLEAGRHAEAMHELATAFRVRDMIRSEPTLIAHLVIMTCDSMLLQPVWEGLAARRWTADELRAIQTQLRADDLLADYAQAVRGERVFFVCRWLDGLRKSGNTRDLVDAGFGDFDGDTKKLAARLAALFPAGWIDQNEAKISLAYQKLITDTLDLKTRRVSVARVKAQQRERDREGSRFVPTGFLLRIELPVFESVLTRATRTQTACEQAEVACALERYFLEHKTYPVALVDLLPEFLDRVPTDLVDGMPMRYRHTDDGRYLLYGIGWNERDDGGVIAWPKSASNTEFSKPDSREGDWCWQYQPILPPVH